MSASAGMTEGRDWFWPALVAGAIFFASSQSRVSGPPVPGVDKMGHFLAYGLLGTLLARVPALARSRPLGAGAAVLLASLYGLTDEFHQSFTPGRSVELADWLADTSGAALAVLVYCRWAAYQRFLEKPLQANARVDLHAGQTPD